LVELNPKIGSQAVRIGELSEEVATSLAARAQAEDGKDDSNDDGNGTCQQLQRSPTRGKSYERMHGTRVTRRPFNLARIIMSQEPERPPATRA
jgi:hypothetical protein